MKCVPIIIEETTVGRVHIFSFYMHENFSWNLDVSSALPVCQYYKSIKRRRDLERIYFFEEMRGEFYE